MRLGDVAIGQRYWLNGKQYLRIADNVLECFCSKSFRDQIVVSLCLESYQVMVQNKEYEVLLGTYQGYKVKL